MTEVAIEGPGPRDLGILGARLKEAGARDLRLELLRGMRKAAEQVKEPIQQSAHDKLPKGGGLAEEVAAQKVGIRTSFAASGARVRLVDAGMKELDDINRGRLRHPVYGNRKVWKAQEVEPGFFTDPVEEHAPEIRRTIQKAMDDVARKITGGI